MVNIVRMNKAHSCLRYGRLTLGCFSSFDVGCGGLSDGRQRFEIGAKFDSGGLSKLLANLGHARLPGSRSGRGDPLSWVCALF